MSTRIVRAGIPRVNPPVPIGPLDALCTLLADLSNELADRAAQSRAAREARLTVLAIETAIAAHQFEQALGRLLDEMGGAPW